MNHHMNRRLILPVLATLLLSTAGFAQANTFSTDGDNAPGHASVGGGVDGARPNIVYIMVDDMGYADLGAHGCKDISTPNLDRLAEQGVMCTSAYVTHPFCGPSRAGFMTGRYQHRFGFETNPAYDPANPYYGLDLNQTTFVERLQKAGYRTGGVGKWHLGAAPDYHPNNRGFDYFYGFLGGGHDYWEIDLLEPVAEGYKQGLVRNNQPATFNGYLTDALSKDAVGFINRNAKNSQPFFLFVAYNAPHAPIQAKEEDMAVHAHIKNDRRRAYAGMVYSVDRGLGRMLDALEQHNIRNNTLVCFLSDNGGPLAKPGSPGHGTGASNLPLQGGKGSMYEGGDRVPFLASWPGTLPEGKTYERPIISLDLSMTAVALAKADANTGTPLDGVNLIPYFTDEAEGDPHEAIFWRRRNGIAWGARAGDLKALKADWDKKDIELYDLASDIGETQNLAESRSEDLEAMKALYRAWNADNIKYNFLDYAEYHPVRDNFYKNEMNP